MSAIFLGLVAYFLDWQQALSLFRSTNKSEFVIGLVLLLAAYLVNGMRLRRIQQRADLEMPTPLFWGSYFTGILFNYILPSGVGGDAVRVAFLTRRGYRLGALIVSGLADRFFGLIGLFAIAGIAIFLSPSVLPFDETAGRLFGAALVLSAILGIWWLPKLGSRIIQNPRSAKKGRWRSKIQNSWQFVQKIFNRPGQLIEPAGLSLLSHTLCILSYASCGQSILPNMDLVHYFLAIPGVMLILTIPISLGGLGLREVSTVGILVWFGADPQAALTLSLVYLLISWISLVPGVISTIHYGFGTFNLKDQKNAS